MHLPSLILAAMLPVMALLATPILAAEPPQASGYVPVLMPKGCSETDDRVLLWRDAVNGTRCVTPRELLKLMLPGCKAGQHIIHDGKEFGCSDPVKTGAGQ